MSRTQARRSNGGYLSDNSTTRHDSGLVNEPNPSSEWGQQVVPAWYPVRTNGCVISWFVIIGLFLLIQGLLIQIIFNDSVVEVEGRYDNLPCDDGNPPHCNKTITFKVPETMEKPVFLYYKLSGFYQNHRLYAQSRSDEQLHGAKTDDVGSCYPLAKWTDDPKEKKKILYPCGLIANSFFNDTITNDTAKVTVPAGTESETVELRKKGIAWDTDVDDKYHAREPRPNEVTTGPGGFELPRPNDEDMIVWLRVASMSTFRKLFRIIDTTLPKNAEITFTIKNRFPSHKIHKSLVLATASAMGGSQSFLAYFCSIFGALCIIVAIAFYFANRHKRPDHVEYFFNPDEHVTNTTEE